MKIFFLFFAVLPFLSFGNQSDTIFLKSKEYIVCDVIKLENNEIFYKLINDDYIKNIQNDEVSRVIYLLGESTIIKKNIEPKSNFIFEDNNTRSLREEKLSLSPIIGLNFSKLHSKFWKDLGGQTNLVRLSYGAAIKYDFHKSFALVSEILITTKGNRFEEEVLYTDILGNNLGIVQQIYERRHSYISLPLKFEYEGALKNNFLLKFRTGAYYGYLFKAEEYIHLTGDALLDFYDSDEYTRTYKIEIDSTRNKNDYGLIFEFGLVYELNKLVNINIDFGYHHGFSNIYNNESEETFSFPSDYYFTYNRSYFVNLLLQYYL